MNKYSLSLHIIVYLINILFFFLFIIISTQKICCRKNERFLENIDKLYMYLFTLNFKIYLRSHKSSIILYSTYSHRSINHKALFILTTLNLRLYSATKWDGTMVNLY